VADCTKCSAPMTIEELVEALNLQLAGGGEEDYEDYVEYVGPAGYGRHLERVGFNLPLDNVL